MVVWLLGCLLVWWFVGVVYLFGGSVLGLRTPNVSNWLDLTKLIVGVVQPLKG